VFEDLFDRLIAFSFSPGLHDHDAGVEIAIAGMAEVTNLQIPLRRPSLPHETGDLISRHGMSGNLRRIRR
jgi:hypothetical protein